MQKLQAFRFELIPNGEQRQQMRCFAGSCRFVFNKALAYQIEQYQSDPSTKFSYTTLANLLPGWKKEFTWLAAAPSQTLQQSLKHLESAYKNFFAQRAEFPKFKKKGLSSDSFRFPQGFKIDEPNSRIFLPKLGWMRYRNSRNILGTPKNITVSCVAGKWHASVQTEQEVEQAVHPAISMVGVDVGIAKFATLSDGTVFEPVNSFKQKQRRLTILQRQMSHKVKFSSNWKKAKARVTRLHAKIARIRQDYLHKTTTTLSKSHALVVIEDLQVKNMSASVRGTVSKPGRNIRQKSGLNKSILDQGWFEFRRQLTYKQEWRGGEVLAVPPHHTSQTCPVCSHVSAENRKTQSKFECVNCGYKANADMVAAMNILERGHRLSACGDPMQQGRSVKQEPAEVTKQVVYA
jgi:putative transposase